MTGTPEHDILTLVADINRCWTEGDPADLEKYFHERMVAITPVDRFRREGRDTCITGWAGFAHSTRIRSWIEHDHDVRFFGDTAATAVVTYYYDLILDTPGGPITLTGRDMLTLVNENKRWWLVADQFSPFPG